MTPPHPAKPKADAAEVLQKRLHKAVERAMEWAGSLPAKNAVKLRPSDWHAVCDVAREIAALAASPSDEITALRAERDAALAELATMKDGAKQLVGLMFDNALKLGEVIEALRRISTATPRNTNSATAEQMRSWCRAVAETALARAALSQDRTEVSHGGKRVMHSDDRAHISLYAPPGEA